MLQWFVDEEVCTVVLKDCGKLVEENEVEVRPEKLPDAAIDENVGVCLIRKYFTSDAWLLVEDVLERKQDNPARHAPMTFIKNHQSCVTIVCRGHTSGVSD